MFLALALSAQLTSPAISRAESPPEVQTSAAAETPEPTNDAPKEEPGTAPPEQSAQETPAASETETPSSPADTPQPADSTETPTEPAPAPSEEATATPLPTPETTEAPSESPTATPEVTPAPKLSIDEEIRQNGIAVGADGVHGRMIGVSSNVAWTVKADAEWIHLAVSDQKDGFSLTVDANAGEAREGRIELKAAECDTIIVHLHQSAAAEASPEPSELPVETEVPSETETPAPEETLEPSPVPGMEDQNPDDLPTDAPPTLEPVERDYNVGWKGVVPSDEAGMGIPMLFQGDYGQTILYYNGEARSVASSGCGATSVSMVIAYLTGNVEQNPYLLFCKAVDDGRYHGNGLSHDTLVWLAKSYGVKCRWISNSADAVLEALAEGKPVIAHMGEGIFTSKGHYIVLRGVTEDGKILVNDPNSRSNCHKAFPLETILAQTRTSASFMVCWTESEAPVEPTIEPTLEPSVESTLEATVEPTTAPQPVWGDVNGSGSVDMNDVQLIYDIVSGQSAGDFADRADVNGDGAVDNADIEQLMQFILDGTRPEPQPAATAESTELPMEESSSGEMPEETAAPEPSISPDSPTIGAWDEDLPAETIVPPSAETTVPPPAETTVPPSAETIAPPSAEATVLPSAETIVPPSAETIVPPSAETIVPPSAEATLNPFEGTIPNPTAVVPPSPSDDGSANGDS